MRLDVSPTLGNILNILTSWGFPKIRSTILGVPIIRTIVFWGLYWGPLIWETTSLVSEGSCGSEGASTSTGFS